MAANLLFMTKIHTVDKTKKNAKQSSRFIVWLMKWTDCLFHEHKDKADRGLFV